MLGLARPATAAFLCFPAQIPSKVDQTYLFSAPIVDNRDRECAKAGAIACGSYSQAERRCGLLNADQVLTAELFTKKLKIYCYVVTHGDVPKNETPASLTVWTVRSSFAPVGGNRPGSTLRRPSPAEVGARNEPWFHKGIPRGVKRKRVSSQFPENIFLGQHWAATAAQVLGKFGKNELGNYVVLRKVT